MTAFLKPSASSSWENDGRFSWIVAISLDFPADGQENNPMWEKHNPFRVVSPDDGGGKQTWSTALPEIPKCDV
jgi:hypothetical protein